MTKKATDLGKRTLDRLSNFCRPQMILTTPEGFAFDPKEMNILKCEGQGGGGEQKKDSLQPFDPQISQTMFNRVAQLLNPHTKPTTEDAWKFFYRTYDEQWMLTTSIELREQGFINPLEAVEHGMFHEITPPLRTSGNEADNGRMEDVVFGSGAISSWISDALLNKAELYKSKGREEAKLSVNERIQVVLEAYYELAKEEKPTTIKRLKGKSNSSYLLGAKKIIDKLRNERDEYQHNIQTAYLGMLMLKAAHVEGGLSISKDKIEVWVEKGKERYKYILPLNDMGFLEKYNRGGINRDVSNLMDRIEAIVEARLPNQLELPRFWGAACSFTDIFALTHYNRSRVYLAQGNYAEAEKDCLRAISISNSKIITSKDLKCEIGNGFMAQAEFKDTIRSVYLYLAGKAPIEEARKIDELIKDHVSVAALVEAIKKGEIS